LANEFTQDLGTDNVPDVVRVYREALAAAPDQSVKFVTVGFKLNLENLLKSPADDISDLTGVELVAQKVVEYSDMGGAYPQGNEFNFNIIGSASKYVVENWPTPIVFSGFEIGVNISTGAPINTAEHIPTNPVARAYELYCGRGNGRSSWDLTSVLYAVRGLGDYFNISDEGCNIVEPSGQNSWDGNSQCGHRYLIKKMSEQDVANVLNDMLLVPPVPQAEKPDFQIHGCTDSDANNYNENASVDDGSCTYDPCCGTEGFVEYDVNCQNPQPDMCQTAGIAFQSVKPVSLHENCRGLTVYVGEAGPHHIKVTDVHGTRIAEKTGNGPHEYNLREVNRAGIYFIRITTSKGAKSKRVTFY
jgi:hypothetical protein